MNALELYIEKENSTREIFGQSLLTYPKNDSEKNKILDMIECDLSPENLSCDGELSPNEVHKKAHFLYGAKHILEQL